MDGELLRKLYHELFHHRKLKSGGRFIYSDATILWIYFVGVVNDRSMRWAHDSRNWPLWARRLERPSYSQLMRRLGRPSIREDIDALNRSVIASLPKSTDKTIDGKPMTVGIYSKDPDARFGKVSKTMWGRGYKLHAIGNKHGVIEAFIVTGLNAGESTIARSLVRLTDMRDAILRGDSNYDSSPTYAAVAEQGGRLIAPRRKAGTGLSRRKHHPDRLRAIEELEHNEEMGTRHRRHRVRIEQTFGHLTNLPCGLAPLPNCVRRLHRVERWVAAKILLYHLQLAEKYTLVKAA